MHLIISHSTNPFKNLAIENLLLTHLDKNESILLLWKNKPCVVMGRFQNPWIECDLHKMERDGVDLVRRQSGGGCVYHDLGNINFSFINWRKNHDKKNNQKFWIEFFNKNDVPVETNERDDLVLRANNQTYKISGSAFKQKKDTAFHHGTLLFNTDLDKLNGYLLAGKREKDFQSKSIASVRSTVANLNSFITMEQFFNKLKTSSQFDSITDFKANDTQDKFINNYMTSLKDKDWLWGETPYFSTSLKFENISVELEVKKAKMNMIKIIGSSIHDSLLVNLSDQIIGVPFHFQSIVDCFDSIEGSEIFRIDFLEILELINSKLIIKY